MCVSTGKGVRTVLEDRSGNLVLAACTALLYSLKAPTHLLLLRQTLLPVLESPPPPSKLPYPRLTSPSVKPSSLSSNHLPLRQNLPILDSPHPPSKPPYPRLTILSVKTSLSSTHHTLRQNLPVLDSPHPPSKPPYPRLTTPSVKTSLSSTHHTLRQNLLFVFLLARRYHSGSSLNGKVGGASLIRFSSRRPLCARKGPYALHSVPQKFPKTLPLKQFQCSSD